MSHAEVYFSFITNHRVFISSKIRAFVSKNHKNRQTKPSKNSTRHPATELYFPFQAEIKLFYDHTTVHGLSSSLEGLDNH